MSNMSNFTIADRNNIPMERDNPQPDLPHISVCIPTYRRPIMLDSCMQALQDQEPGPFRYSIVVVDNDISESARDIPLAPLEWM